jgi:hypothetical protein
MPRGFGIQGNKKSGNCRIIFLRRGVKVKVYLSRRRIFFFDFFATGGTKDCDFQSFLTPSGLNAYGIFSALYADPSM